MNYSDSGVIDRMVESFMGFQWPELIGFLAGLFFIIIMILVVIWLVVVSALGCVLLCDSVQLWLKNRRSNR